MSTKKNAEFDADVESSGTTCKTVFSKMLLKV